MTCSIWLGMGPRQWDKRAERLLMLCIWIWISSGEPWEVCEQRGPGSRLKKDSGRGSEEEPECSCLWGASGFRMSVSSPEKQRPWSEGGTQSLKCCRVIHDETCIDLDLCGMSETAVLRLGPRGVGGPVLKGSSLLRLRHQSRCLEASPSRQVQRPRRSVLSRGRSEWLGWKVAG